MSIFTNLSVFADESDYKFDIDSGTIKRYIGDETTIVIPSTIAGFPVTKIGSEAFYGNSNLRAVVINSNIETIGRNAFSHCTSLESVVINSDELTLGRSTFSYCTNLKNVNIKANKLSAEDSIFAGCSSLESISLPENTNDIPSCMFEGCEKLAMFNIPNSVKTIGESAFSGCSSLKNISLPSNITEIGAYAFSKTGIENIIIPENVKSIAGNAFYDTPLKNISLGNIETIIYGYRDNVFEHTEVEELVLPHSLTGRAGFLGSNLKKITVFNDDLEITGVPDDCVIYCGSASKALKYAVSNGLKYVIIQTNKIEPTNNTSSKTAILSNQNVDIDGTSVDIESYNIDGSNYFKLKDIAYLLVDTKKEFGVSFDSSTNSVSIIPSTSYIKDGNEFKKTGVSSVEAIPATSKFYYAGQSVDVSAYNINGSNYFKLRDIANLVNFGVVFDPDTKTTYIISNAEYSN